MNRTLKKRETKRIKRRRPDTAAPPAYNPSAAVCSVVLLGLTLLMAAPRLHTYDEPLDMDVTTYTVMANEMHSGRHLYSELWDHKPPAIYVSYYLAQGVAGAGPAHVFGLGLLLAVVTLLGVYFAASQAAGPLAGLLAAGFWAIVSADLHLQANQPNAEPFINACIIWAFGLLIRMPSDRNALGRALSIGALIGLASLYKNIAVCAGGMMVAHIVASRFTRQSCVQAIVAAVVIAVAWAGVLGYFAATDRFAAFVSTVFEFNRMYAGSLWNNVIAGLQPASLVPPVLLQFWPLMLPAAVGLVFSRDTISPRARVLLLALCLTTFLSVALPGKFFRHYYQLWLPFLCVSAAWGIAALRRMTKRVWLLPAASTVVVALLALLQLHNFSLSPEQWTAAKYGDRLLLSKRAAGLINHLLRPEEKFFQWGHHVDLYYYADRRPVGGEFRTNHLLNGTRQAERTAQLLTDLQRDLPELVILVAGHEFPRNHPVPQWITEHYRPLAAQPCDREVAARYLFLARNGGRLTEVQAGPCLEG